MQNKRALVMGASGFLGSHICKQLVAAGVETCAFVRETSNTSTIDALGLETFYGDVMAPETLRPALASCDVVFYCIVDTRAWLKDTSPLWRTNIDGLRNVLDAAVESDIERFIFTSSIVTIGLNESGVATEADSFNWASKAPDYVLCRTQAEDMVFDYCRQRQLPAIALCVANTYGPGDIQPTPHGGLIKAVALEQTSLPIDCENPVVDIRDAAQAMILAADRGRVGERYIIAAEHANQVELFWYAAQVAGVKPPKFKLSVRAIWTLAFVVENILKLFGKRIALNTESVLLSHVFNEMDCSKAREELGWEPRPIKESIHDAVHFYLQHPD